MNQDYIACKLNKDRNINKIKILYLHGSWFIQANEKDELRKLEFGDGSTDTIYSLFENARRPFLILEDRWRTKKAILGADPYFKYCHRQLKGIQKKLTYFWMLF